MTSLMESKMTPEQHAMIRNVLVAQTESIGMLEIPIVEEMLKRGKSRSVLDIGCGEGSFVLELARRIAGTRFLGIDQNELAISDALRRLRRRKLRNVMFRPAFFDSRFEPAEHDAVMTRYTLQHSSDPRAFVDAVFKRLKRKGLFIALESLDAYTDCHEPDPVWERFKTSVAAIHGKVGSNSNIGKSLGVLFRNAGFRDIRVRVILCSPSTVGWKKFQAVVQASADLAYAFFPDLFDGQLRDDVTEWLRDRAAVERKDPYLCSAIADAVKP
jgi:ubiquinone/menaquinone biosynthesis C-methylase UbiE